LVIWPVKIVPEMTYNVSSGTLNCTHSLMSALDCTRSILLDLSVGMSVCLSVVYQL